MRSGFEKTFSRSLRDHSIRFKYEPFTIPYVLKSDYIPDFALTKKDGSDMLIETKGYLKPSDRRKLKAVKDQHPEMDIRIVFQQDNFLTKTKKSRYSDWAIKNGFKCSIGFIPKEWIKELI